MRSVDQHQQELSAVFQQLATGENGLTETEAGKRLAEHGPNALKEGKGPGRLQLFFSQFNSFLVYILLAAAVISLVAESVLDFYTIIAIVIINAVLGYVQESKAEKAMEALKKLTTATCVVIRGGQARQIDSRELVPGDIVVLEEGQKVPADVRLLEAREMKADESALTGESVPVRKVVGVVKSNAVAERVNTVLMGTVVVTGRGKGIVVATGMGTEIGAIATIVGEQEHKLTPLQKNLSSFGRRLGMLILAISAVVFVAGVLRGNPIMNMAMEGIALAVAAIPEGLPAIVTITLAFGMRRMAGKHALLRKLAAAETLGTVTIICSDKTGTLTRGEMVVRKVFAGLLPYEVSGEGYRPAGSFTLSNKKVNPHKEKVLRMALACATLCNNSFLSKGKESGIIGDPTEGALLVAAAKAFDVEKLRKEFPRLDEVPFTSERKMMSTVHSSAGKKLLFVKGAPEVVLARCTHLLHDGKKIKLFKKERDAIGETNKKYAGSALRVLACAYRELPAGKKISEENLVFLGLMGMIDSPREGVAADIKKCRAAGIRTVMITGDNPETAKAIARELGLMKEGEMVMTGADLDRLSTKQLRHLAEKVNVYARVNPVHKASILQALKANGHIVAMTGDGVNDAPALKKADIGVAMGIRGTDVAKDASDMVLEDDHFSTIVDAVEEGRHIYDNILRFILYLLSSNMAEVIAVFAGIVAGLPLPILALQLLWMNLVTDSFPATALGSEPPAADIMKRKPRSPKESILGRGRLIYVFGLGAAMATVTLVVFIWALPAGYHYAATMAFTSMVVMELYNVFNTKALPGSVLRTRLNNRPLVLAVLFSFVLQLAVLYLPPLQAAFSTVPLGLADWGMIGGSGLLVFAAGAALKGQVR